MLWFRYPRQHPSFQAVEHGGCQCPAGLSFTYEHLLTKTLLDKMRMTWSWAHPQSESACGGQLSVGLPRPWSDTLCRGVSGLSEGWSLRSSAPPPTSEASSSMAWQRVSCGMRRTSVGDACWWGLTVCCDDFAPTQLACLQLQPDSALLGNTHWNLSKCIASVRSACAWPAPLAGAQDLNANNLRESSFNLLQARECCCKDSEKGP